MRRARSQPTTPTAFTVHDAEFRTSDSIFKELNRRARSAAIAIADVRSPRHYLHGVPWLDAHHFHRDAPPDQQEAGRSLKTDGARCAGSGGDASATFGLGRQSEDSSEASPAPHGARGTLLAGGLTSVTIRRPTVDGGGPAGGGGLGGKAFLAASGRLPRCAGGSSGISPVSR